MFGTQHAALGLQGLAVERFGLRVLALATCQQSDAGQGLEVVRMLAAEDTAA